MTYHWGISQLPVGNITITSSSKPNPGVAIARAIEKTYSSDYAGHCRNHSVRLYGKPGAWAEATEKECLDEVKKFPVKRKHFSTVVEKRLP